MAFPGMVRAGRIRGRVGRAICVLVRIAPYWWRAPFYRWTPGGFGYYRRLRRYADPSYHWTREHHPLRAKHRGARALRPPDETGLVRRDYGSYTEYVVHQQQKLAEILRSGGFSNAAVSTYRRLFYRRFRHLVRLLPRDALIVCLGARQGTEVEVLRQLGFHRAYGIDLNPGPENDTVRLGDFHVLDEPDASVDLVYSNSLDHAIDLDAFFAEHRRVLRSDGYALYDIHAGYQPGENVAFEATLWRRREQIVRRLLEHFQRVLKLEAEPSWTWLLLQHPEPLAKPVRAVSTRSQKIASPPALWRARPRRTRTKATALVAAALIAIFALLPEALGDRPYDPIGHHHHASRQPVHHHSAAGFA